MFCINCGAQQPDGARFCSACGQAIQMPQSVQLNRTSQERVERHVLPEGPSSGAVTRSAESWARAASASPTWVWIP